MSTHKLIFWKFAADCWNSVKNLQCLSKNYNFLSRLYIFNARRRWPLTRRHSALYLLFNGSDRRYAIFCRRTGGQEDVRADTAHAADIRADQEHQRHPWTVRHRLVGGGVDWSTQAALLSTGRSAVHHLQEPHGQWATQLAMVGRRAGDILEHLLPSGRRRATFQRSRDQVRKPWVNNSH